MKKSTFYSSFPEFRRYFSSTAEKIFLKYVKSVEHAGLERNQKIELDTINYFLKEFNSKARTQKVVVIQQIHERGRTLVKSIKKSDMDFQRQIDQFENQLKHSLDELSISQTKYIIMMDEIVTRGSLGSIPVKLKSTILEHIDTATSIYSEISKYQLRPKKDLHSLESRLVEVADDPPSDLISFNKLDSLRPLNDFQELKNLEDLN
ncbi:MAG: hypothetical protein IH840_13565 [Candidatus Heimdallarchaeota archaeon]|nr:hypothetical protein [Candidatus Heimdallarchaeota archaeon]